MHGDFLLAVIVFLPMLGALASYAVGRFSKPARDLCALIVCLAELLAAAFGFALIVSGKTLDFYWDGFCALGLHLRLDGFRATYVLIAALMWVMTTGLFSPAYFASHYHNRNRYYLFALLTLGATCGVFLASSLYTAFIFFEIMSLTSYVWVAHDEAPSSLRAAQTYLAVAIIGGMSTLMGLFMLYHRIGTLEIDAIYAACAQLEDKSPLYVTGALIASGFAAKAGVFPLHIWLPKAHPVAPAPASALLSGMLTKTGIFGILVVSANIFLHDAAWGRAVLALGVATMFVGALLALFSIDLKKTLACSSISQIGFILVGVGMAGLLGEENGLAVYGALLHMVNHSLIKLTLFMSAGAVYMRLHRLNLNEIRGFGRGKPVLRFAFLMGYLSIIGMPLWSGFVSKSLLHESIVEYIAVLAENGMAAWPYRLIEIIFLVTGGMTAAYMTKLYVALFCEKNADAAEQKRFDGMAYMPLNARLALVLSAALLPVLGVFSNALMRPVAQLCQSFMNSEGPAEAVNYFSGANLLGAAESLLIGAALYFGVVRMLLMKKNAQGVREYVDRWPRWLDLENGVYRPLLEKILPGLVMPATRFLDRLADYARVVLNAAATFAVRIMDECVDGVVLILKRTLFGRPKKRQPVPVGNRFTYSLGCVFDSVVLVLNKTFCRKRPIETRFVSVFAAGLDEMNDNVKKITRSVSFGLLLLCVGLYIAFAYILTR